MQKEMNVAIAVNERYMRYAYVMLTSLFENHRDAGVNVYVLHSDLTEESVKKLYSLGKEYEQNIHTMRMDADLFPKQLPCNNDWTMEIYYRLALPDLMPKEMERILYLDVDVIVINSIWDFYSADFEGKSLCVCPDMSAAGGLPEKQRELFRDMIDKPDFRYFNTGVLLINLEKVRKSFNLEQFCRMGLELPLVAPDQDLLNYIFYKDVIFREEEKFDLFARISYHMGQGYEWVKEHTAIVHYAGLKPWAYRALHFEVERFWWEYAKKTPFYVEFLEEIVLNEVDTNFMEQLVGKMEREKNELLGALNKCMAMLKNIEKNM